MAPEQLTPEEVAIDHRADIYAMGVTTYEALCGKPPFAGNNPIQVAVDVVSTDPEPLSERAPGAGAELESVVMKALAKSPDNRFADANEFIAELQAAAGFEVGESEVRVQSGFAPRFDADSIEDIPGPAPIPACPRPSPMFGAGPSIIAGTAAANSPAGDFSMADPELIGDAIGEPSAGGILKPSGGDFPLRGPGIITDVDAKKIGGDFSLKDPIVIEGEDGVSIKISEKRPRPRPAAKRPEPVEEPLRQGFIGRVREAFSVSAASGAKGAPGAASGPEISVISAGVDTQIGRLDHARAPDEYFSSLKERAPFTISSWQKDVDAGKTAFFENNNKRLKHLEEMIAFYAKHLDADFGHLTAQMRWTQRLWLLCVFSMFLVMGGAIWIALFRELDLESIGVIAMAELLAGFLLKVFQSREEHYRKLRDRKGEHLVYGRRWSLAVQSIDAMPPGEHKAAAIKDLVKVLLREMEPAKAAA